MKGRALLATVVCFWIARDARAERDEAAQRADAAFARAVHAYQAGALAEALEEFRRAYEAKPHSRVLYNMAQLHASLGDPCRAVRTYKRYLSDASATDTRRRAEATGQIERLQGACATLVLQVSEGTTSIKIDGETVEMPGEDHVVSPGKHKVTANVARAPFSAEVVVAAKERATVVMGPKAPPAPTAPVVTPAVATPPVAPEPSPAPALPPTTATATAPVTPPAKEERGTRTEAPPNRLEEREASAWPWVGWGSTAALGTATAVTAIMAVDRIGDYEAKKSQFGVTPQELSGAQSAARTMAFVSTGLGVLAVASAGVSTWLTLRSSAERKAEARSGLRLGAGHVSFEGAF